MLIYISLFSILGSFFYIFVYLQTQINRMKKLFIIIMLAVLIINIYSHALPGIELNELREVSLTEFDETRNASIGIIYRIYDDEGNYLLEKVDASVGDMYIDKNFDIYKIYSVNDFLGMAEAKYVGSYKKPSVSRTPEQKMTRTYAKKNIGVYCTHNDESYIIGDGIDSIYGAGGIHDVAGKLKKELTDKNINVIFDETLHVPHNSSAYTRSQVTANRLLKENDLDAIFDIHRDGVSRNSYVTINDDKEMCQIMIVVGQANPNKNYNLQFALDLLSVSEEIAPWLFKDIYFATGHYNQALSSTSLLFEIGTHTIEKSLAMESIPFLANIINTTIYNTYFDENNENLIIIESTKNTANNNLKKHLIYTFVAISILVLTSLSILIFYIKKKNFGLPKIIKK